MKADTASSERVRLPCSHGGFSASVTAVARKIWVNWILDAAGRKRPVAPWQTNHAYPVEWHANLDAADRPETDFDTANRWAEFPLSAAGLSLPDDAQSNGIETGIILPNDRPAREQRLTLIDWDDVRDPDTGETHPVVADSITQFGGYVEVSTSGTGLHQFVLGGFRKRGKFIAPIDDDPLKLPLYRQWRLLQAVAGDLCFRTGSVCSASSGLIPASGCRDSIISSETRLCANRCRSSRWPKPWYSPSFVFPMGPSSRRRESVPDTVPRGGSISSRISAGVNPRFVSCTVV